MTTTSVLPARTASAVFTRVRRVPFTAAFLVTLLAVGLGTGALWAPAENQPWFGQVAFGLPAFQEGRVWTVVTGPFFALTPLFYLPVIVSFALFVGFAELRPGAFAALAATSATLRAPWRLRLRLVLLAYVVLAVLYGGSLADLEHCLAVLLALPLARPLAGAARVPGRGRPSRREWRLLAMSGLLVAAAVAVVTTLFPADGPLGPTGSGDSLIDTVVLLVLTLLVVRGLSRGRRLAWLLTVIVATADVVLAVGVGVVLLIGSLANAAVELNGVPLFVTHSVFWAAFLVLLIAGREAFRVPSRRRYRRRAGAPPDREQVMELVTRNGGGTLSWMTTWPENRYFPLDDGAGFVAYRRHAGVAVALGDPVCPAGARESAVLEFADDCDRAGLVPCLFSATAPSLAAAQRLGWRALQVAEDTLVDLPGLEFRGKQWQPARSALNRAAKEGVLFRLGVLADEPRSVLTQVRAISEEWVGDKGLPEMGFTLGGVDEALDRHVRVGLAIDGAGRVHGVTSWIPVYAGEGRIEGWTLDVMRRRTDGFEHVVEFLIASACQAFRDEGARFISLSGAPLARTGRNGQAAVLDGLLDRLGAALEPYYGFRSLHAFKAKFRPRHEPMYLLYRDEADLPRIGVAIARAYLPTMKLRDLPKLAARS